MSTRVSGKIGFAIVGCGVIAPMHEKAIRAQPDAELIAVMDIDPEIAKQRGAEFGVPFYTDLDALFARDDVQVVDVCVPSGLHAEIGVKAALAGKHVICEKPIDISLAAADRLTAACKEAGVKLQVISQHRFSNAMQQLKEAVDAGKFGRLVMGNASIFWYRAQSYYDSGGWRGTWELDGGGALMNQGVHWVDQLRWIMGPVKSVSAKMGMLAHERIEVEDAVVAVVEFENGAIGSIIGTTDAYPGYTTRLEIVGTEGSAIIEDGNIRAWNLKSEGGEVGAYGRAKSEKEAEAAKATNTQGGGAGDPAAIGWGGHAYQVRDMMNAIREDHETANPGTEARNPLELILGVYQSALTDAEVVFPVAQDYRPGAQAASLAKGGNA